eukprot:g2918.t1
MYTSREQVQDELRSTKVDEKERRKLIEIFNRFQTQSDDSSEAEETDPAKDDWIHELSEDNILRIQQSDDDIIETLPAKLIEEFEEFLKTENVAKSVQIWTPWWESADVSGLQLSTAGTALVQEMENRGGKLNALIPKLPETPIPRLESLTKASVISESIRWQLLQVYLVYCYIMRRYNGDWKWDAAENLRTILNNLAMCFDAKNIPLSSAEQTVQEFIEVATAPPIGSSNERHFLITIVLRDVLKLITDGRSVMILALNDFATMVTQVRREIRGKHKKDPIHQRLKSGERKMTFLLAWVNCANNNSQLEVFLLETQKIAESLNQGMKTRKQVEVIVDEIEKPTGTLITEL